MYKYMHEFKFNIGFNQNNIQVFVVCTNCKGFVHATCYQCRYASTMQKLGT